MKTNDEKHGSFTRRGFLGRTAGVLAALPFTGLLTASGSRAAAASATPAAGPAPAVPARQIWRALW